jgi:hypothetical protein
MLLGAARERVREGAAIMVGKRGPLSLIMVLATSCGDDAGGGGSSETAGGAGAGLEAGRLLIEHNATDRDTGFQGFADGEPWNQLVCRDPSGEPIFTAMAGGGLLDFGLTEFFFETNEPENAEVPIPDVLMRLPEGDYTYEGTMVQADPARIVADFTHDIPRGPTINAPMDGATALDPALVVVQWDPVTQDLDGKPLTIVGYEVIVEEDVAPEFPATFAQPVLDVHVSADATQLTVPVGFLQDDRCYHFEVLAIETSGNQTLSSGAFETGNGCSGGEPPEPELVLTAAKLLIEHNATDHDTGFQGFADGDPWSELTIADPDGQIIATITPRGALADFGFTELFFETNEPENAETPIPDVLARLPEGDYTFTAQIIGGSASEMTATFSHVIPAGPVLTAPTDGATDVDPDDTVVSWESVTTDLDGNALAIVGYQVIVEDALEPPEFPQGFAQPVFSVYLPADAKSITVPAEFMQSATEYTCEVLAIEESGNQTLSLVGFTTM